VEESLVPVCNVYERVNSVDSKVGTARTEVERRKKGENGLLMAGKLKTWGRGTRQVPRSKPFTGKRVQRRVSGK